MSVSGGIISATREHVETIEINRPDRRNALSREDRFALRSALRDADRDPNVRVIVLTGAGEHFCSGGDVREFTVERDWDAAHEYALTAAQMVFRTVRAMQTPTVARVRGAAAGAGMSLALGCDIDIADTGAFFHPAHLDLAVIPDWGLLWLLPRLVGTARAKAILLGRRRVAAQLAADWGLIAECVEPGELDKVVTNYCARLAEVPPVPMGLARQGLDRSLDTALEPFLNWEASAIADTVSRPEHRERVDRFLTRR
jgi:2-(1,2-epoxy-1,2-dihydrophenyl)acetyl-CoA isomerase